MTKGDEMPTEPAIPRKRRSAPVVMRTLICILFVGAILLTGCRRDSSSATAIPLSFYVVHDEKVEGGRFIDKPDFPKLGYIAATPDLVVQRLQSVDLDASPPFSLELPAVSIALRSVDAPSFTALTERAIDKKLLVMSGHASRERV
jgi:hypothetical protein